MDLRLRLSRIDEDLDSSEVSALRFLCRDVVSRKRLESATDAKRLFERLEEKSLLENDAFLSELLQTIGRNDLVGVLRTGQTLTTEADANPMLSDYRVMLYQIYEDVTAENFEKIKFLLEEKLGRRQVEMCDTVLDVFAEMEKKGFLSNTNLNELSVVLREVDLPLAEMVHKYMDRLQSCPPASQSNINIQNSLPHRIKTCLSVSETKPSTSTGTCDFLDSDTTPNTVSTVDETEYYLFTHAPHGLCVVINNEEFNSVLRRRAGSHEDARELHETFTSFGFEVKTHTDLSGAEIKTLLNEYGSRDFRNEDALVVCVLSHGENGCVFGSDAKEVPLRELTQPFTSLRAPSLAGKPKLFFIQACQGSKFQKGSVPFVSNTEEMSSLQSIEADAGPLQGETVPSDADFLLGMSTVPECKSFRSTTSGSIYIQELCKQLHVSAQSDERDDILTILTRVNRHVSKGEYLRHKQMPEPKYTLTKKVVLRYI